MKITSDKISHSSDIEIESTAGNVKIKDIEADVPILIRRRIKSSEVLTIGTDELCNLVRPIFEVGAKIKLVDNGILKFN